MYVLEEQSFPYKGMTEFAIALEAQKGIVIPQKSQRSAPLQELLNMLLQKVFFPVGIQLFIFLFAKDPSKRPSAMDLLRNRTIRETIRKHKLEIPICLKVWNETKKKKRKKRTLMILCKRVG
jgi:hypothetical protein